MFENLCSVNGTLPSPSFHHISSFCDSNKISEDFLRAKDFLVTVNCLKYPADFKVDKNRCSVKQKINNLVLQNGD